MPVALAGDADEGVVARGRKGGQTMRGFTGVRPARPYNTGMALRDRRERLLPGGVPGYV